MVGRELDVLSGVSNDAHSRKKMEMEINRNLKNRLNEQRFKSRHPTEDRFTLDSMKENVVVACRDDPVVQKPAIPA